MKLKIPVEIEFRIDIRIPSIGLMLDFIGSYARSRMVIHHSIMTAL